MEQRVRDEDRRQATIIDSLADGVLMVDATGTVVRVNEAFEVMFEAPRIRVVGQRLDTLLARGISRGLELIDGDGEPIDIERPSGAGQPAERPPGGRRGPRACDGRVARPCGSG